MFIGAVQRLLGMMDSVFISGGSGIVPALAVRLAAALGQFINLGLDPFVDYSETENTTDGVNET